MMLVFQVDLERQLLCEVLQQLLVLLEREFCAAYGRILLDYTAYGLILLDCIGLEVLEVLVGC